MRLSCPECGSKFKVPAKALGESGRKLRCSKCAHEWFQAPMPPDLSDKVKGKSKTKAGAKPKAKAKSKPKAAPEPEVEVDLPDEPDVDDAGAEFGDLRADRDSDLDPPPLGDLSRFRGGRRPERSRRRPPIALLVLAASALAIPAILYAARDSLVEAWGASALLYDTLGAHVLVPGEGLVLQNVYVQRRQEGNVPLLVVIGEIRNPTGQPRTLPALRGTVLDAHGAALQSWLFTAENPKVLAGDVGRFQSELAAPPGEASKVNVTFTNETPTTGVGY